MWLLESEPFEGRKLWLRPGKLYLFGRTAAEAGQLVISDKTVSRKHLTIQVDQVPEGAGKNIHARSKVTVEDLNAKKGTLLNGVQIRGEKKTLSEAENVVKLGLCPKLFRIIWQPVVLSFSFTSKELRADPWAKLRQCLEQLDIKYSAEYDQLTSHVVSKKRNTSKGLQALINGKYIVTDCFINAIVEAATVPDGAEDGTLSALEQDFEGSWPNPLEHLPPRGEEPSDRPPEAYAPDERRQDVFEGYTFVLYEKKQYENLFPAIAHGKGKALLNEVTPGETEVDDFVRYVKGVAGEKGLGSFEDGSEGRGVVVVRFMPSKGDSTEWFAQFLTAFALRLDHRPIDQREFLEAILACDASALRRPLEEASQFEPPITHQPQALEDAGSRMEVDQPQVQERKQEQERAVAPAPHPQAWARRGAASRFKGFDFDSDDDANETPVPAPVELPPAAASASQDSLFVSQHPAFDNIEMEQEVPEAPLPRKSQRKRPLSPLPDHDNSAFMDTLAPTAAAAKRRRIESGQAPVPPPPEPDAMDEDEEIPESAAAKTGKTQTSKGRTKKPVKVEEDILELARQRREEAEARAAAERRELTALPDGDDIDYAAIRALHIIEECEVHLPDREAANTKPRDQAIAEGRWDPRWNGRKNFKKFRKQGETVGRVAPRVIIGLEEVKPKEYGIGDDYWLENEGATNGSSSKRKGSQQSQSQLQTQSKDGTAGSGGGGMAPPPPPSSRRRGPVLPLDSSDEEEDEDRSTGMLEAEDDDDEPMPPEPSRTRAAKAAQKAANTRRSQQSQTQTTATSSAPSTRAGGKRAAAVVPDSDKPPAKRARRGLRVKESDDESDESEDELKFRFGKRK
ncbi:hypothetical protein B0H66DRAFT_186552 [Apodospora peruviana]|uniref:FHA domain-containing protein n=1 Tax=Apodospora peruviana TaxID=516989 RepID=A0AAE0IBG2_9PEZI|nr:hypothetical protein B0H66DRAFT_186552 [Apodospora peruviana]